ncbi:MAG: hypothetical protein A2Z75_03425 [Chloroflexi bacterium RBG_13_50_10]|nr:MAG: hypothetical protein A2Z75_03425 [Chloroflexi bacterium RBG_13_50_10]
MIDGGSRFVDGPYIIRWSKRPIGEEGQEGVDFIVIAKGETPRNTTQINATFTIPEAAYGVNYVQLLRSWRPEAPYGFSFSVLPGIKVNPSSASSGSTVTINGTGFPAKNKEVKLSFDGNDVKQEIISSDLGSFAAQFTIPNTIAGKHEFKATVENLSIGDVAASVQVQPNISLSPEHPDIGAEVTMTGCGFASNSPVLIKYDDIIISSSPTTSSTGNFSHKFVIPESSKDNHVITATDKAGNVATFGLPLEGEAPQSPNPISPAQERFGWFGAKPVAFTWSEASDPSGVTYTLEVDNDLRFFPLEPGLRKTGLTKPSCVVRLQPGTYYWRVKAIDGAGNESDWSLSPFPFQVGLFSIWYLVAGGFIFLIIFIFIVRAFFRRIGEYYK